VNIPDKVKIGWQTYKIIEIEPKEDLITASERFYGQILYDKSKILLKADVSEEQKRNTLLHEIIHAVDEAYNIELSEKQVDTLGNALMAVFIDNPDLKEKVDVMKRQIEDLTKENQKLKHQSK